VDPDRHLPSRRSILRLGGGLVALAVGVGAGIIDRRHRAGPGSTEPAPTTTTTPPSTTATTTLPVETTSTTTVPLVVGDVAPGVLAVGAAYLAESPDEADLATLLALLPSPDGDVVATARALISAEFSAGATIVLDGWVLARSEARAAAVLSLACADSC
jgi:hypothetical protein